MQDGSSDFCGQFLLGGKHLDLMDKWVDENKTVCKMVIDWKLNTLHCLNVTCSDL